MDLDRSGDVWEYRPESHKTEHHGRQRIIYIGPQAQQILLPYLSVTPRPIASPPLKANTVATRSNEHARRTGVQPSQRNRRKAQPKRVPRTAYTRDSYQRAMARAVKKANKVRTEEAADSAQ